MHPSVLVRDCGPFVHIMIDGGPEALCDDCCEPCGDAPFGVRFGSYAVCPACAARRVLSGDMPDEVSRPDESFQAFCDRLNAPMRAKMDRLYAEQN